MALSPDAKEVAYEVIKEDMRYSDDKDRVQQSAEKLLAKLGATEEEKNDILHDLGLAKEQTSPGKVKSE